MVSTCRLLSGAPGRGTAKFIMLATTISHFEYLFGLRHRSRLGLAVNPCLSARGRLERASSLPHRTLPLALRDTS
jgi:hypothetical protein